MNMYNIKYYIHLALYHVSTLVRGLLVIVLKPLNFMVEAAYSIVSDWEPSKPLHKSHEVDYDDPDNYGI